MFLGFSIVSTEEIDKIKSDKELAAHSKKFALISILLSAISIVLAAVAIVYSKHELSVSIFWTRFFCLFLSSCFWGFAISSTCVQFSINKNILFYLSFITTIICTIFLFIAIFL